MDEYEIQLQELYIEQLQRFQASHDKGEFWTDFELAQLKRINRLRRISLTYKIRKD